MRKHSVIFGLGLFLCSTTLCTAKDDVTIKQSKLANSINNFSFALYRKIGESVVQRNVFLSPASISTALAMVYLGTRGDTKSQITSAMHLDVYNTDDETAIKTDFKNLLETLDDPQNNYTLEIANRLFGEKSYSFKEEFLRDTGIYFQAALESIDFRGNPSKSRLQINDWVKDKTSGKIKDLLPDGSITLMTKLALVNAIYFKGLWLHPFKKSVTQSEKFHLSRDKETTIEMMKLDSKHLNYYNSSELGCHVVELPYVGSKSSMLILLPHEIDGLSSVESRIGAESLGKILKGFRKREVKVSLPKFAMDQSVELKTFLKAVGIVDMFEEEKADLSGIDGSRSLVVGTVVHKAFVEVNEEGTEAAGATAVVIQFRSSSYPPRIHFQANRPFQFLIVERTTGSILFLGRLTEPPNKVETKGIGFPGIAEAQRCCISGPDESSSANLMHIFHRDWCCWRTLTVFITSILLILPWHFLASCGAWK